MGRDSSRRCSTVILFRPAGDAPRPAVVFLHGCGGLIGRSGTTNLRERDWAALLNQRGYVVLMVDSFTPAPSGVDVRASGLQP